MNKKITGLVLIGFLVWGLGVSPCRAVHIEKTETTDGLRIELNVLPAEPFYTAEQAKAHPEVEGMLIVGGAAPLALSAKPSPNCHLIVHVFDAKTGKALTDANVTMEYQELHGDKPEGTATQVPVVVMQVIGKGAETTHYGNNVVLPDGRYAVTVVANGNKAVFRIDVSSKEMSPESP